ncbi:50S ribosomal protein L24 [Candidatus Bathyarchaeota archaeon]|nr:MAG: 50S ribosomal protein L24 [Candidatus Bathyarchaeota archaeon ex4484_40]RJS77745.1 MAG: 50S ribosomal protein L24 [Candidatus Bathyarchaeota archaeon]
MKTKTKKPGKQRKRMYRAPHHRRGRYLSAPLSSELKEKYGVNAMPVRRGDTVKVMRGDHKGFEGKVIRVNRKNFRIFIEGITREKADGTTVPVPIHPSKVEILSLNLDDDWRKRILERRGAPKEAEQPEAKLESEETVTS